MLPLACNNYGHSAAAAACAEPFCRDQVRPGRHTLPARRPPASKAIPHASQSIPCQSPARRVSLRPVESTPFPQSSTPDRDSRNRGATAPSRIDPKSAAACDPTGCPAGRTWLPPVVEDCAAGNMLFGNAAAESPTTGKT